MKKVAFPIILFTAGLFLTFVGCGKEEIKHGEAKNVELYICSGCGDTIHADTTDANMQYVIGKGAEYRFKQNFQLCEKCKEKKAEKEIAKEKELGKVEGKWDINMPKGKFTIRNKNGVYKLYRDFADGSSGVINLAEKTTKGQKRLYALGNDFGEYYIIENDGKLGIYDNEGLIQKLNKRN